MISQSQQDIIITTLKPINPDKIGVFGSFARGENKTSSDLDILVFLQNKNKVSLLKLIEVEQSLTTSLGIKVDLVTERSLNPLIRPLVERDLKVIFE